MAHGWHSDEPAVWVRRAWWSLALYVVSFVAAFVVGEGLAGAYGYPSGEDTAPPWVALAAGLPATIVFAAPVLAAWLLARRAHGAPGARAPVLVAAGIALFFLLQNLLAWAAAELWGP